MAIRSIQSKRCAKKANRNLKEIPSVILERCNIEGSDLSHRFDTGMQTELVLTSSASWLEGKMARWLEGKMARGKARVQCEKLRTGAEF